MNKIDLLNMLTAYVKEYAPDANNSIKRNNHMNNNTGNVILQNDIDALLVDFVNFVGMKQGVDYALYTSDLHEVKNE